MASTDVTYIANVKLTKNYFCVINYANNVLLTCFIVQALRIKLEPPTFCNIFNINEAIQSFVTQDMQHLK